MYLNTLVAYFLYYMPPDNNLARIKVTPSFATILQALLRMSGIDGAHAIYHSHGHSRELPFMKRQEGQPHLRLSSLATFN